MPMWTSRKAITADFSGTAHASLDDGSRRYGRGNLARRGEPPGITRRLTALAHAKRVREQIHSGATGSSSTYRDYELNPTASCGARHVYQGKVDALVDEAHRHTKKRVSAFGGGVCHCVNAGRYRRAAIGWECHRRQNEKKKHLLELTAYHYSYPTTPSAMPRPQAGVQSSSVGEEWATGGSPRSEKFLSGQRGRPFPHGVQARRIPFLVKYGMSGSGHSRPPPLCGRMKGWKMYRLIEKGKFADIIAVAGDPLSDITNWTRKIVMKGGKSFAMI